jgi:hypothetical protein
LPELTAAGWPAPRRRMTAGGSAGMAAAAAASPLAPRKVRRETGCDMVSLPKRKVRADGAVGI